MLKARICAPVLAVAFLFWLQPFSYSQDNTGQMGQAVFSADPSLIAFGDLLFFKTEYSKAKGVATEVTLVSPEGGTASATYDDAIFSSIKVGKLAIYALESVPPSSSSGSVTVSLVALVISGVTLPSSPSASQSLSGKIDLLKVAPGAAADGSDVIYLVQTTSGESNVLIFTSNGTQFTPVTCSGCTI